MNNTEAGQRTRQQRILETLSRELEAGPIVIENTSHLHNVRPGSETHFKVTAVSAHFAGLNTVERHRRVYDLLRHELASGLHAIQLKLLSPDEDQTGAFPTPECVGGASGSKK